MFLDPLERVDVGRDVATEIRGSEGLGKLLV